MDVVARAISFLEATKRAPRMYATTREAMMCHITAVVYVLVDELDTIEFWKKHLGFKGNTYLNTQAPVDDDWARGVVEDALRIIGGEKQ